MYRFLRNNKIKPQGWLLDQLRIQANGLSGNLDKVWPDVRESKWIGGDREGWERVPYWLDGFIPLAYMLEDDDMISRAEKYISEILARQKDDGWICPCERAERSNYDLWGYFLITKVLAEYCNITNSRRAKKALYKSLKCLLAELKNKNVSIFGWAKYRWFECFVALDYLYESHKEPWITELGHLLKNEGADYYSFKDRWIEPQNTWTFETHIVNLAQMLKYEALCTKLLGDKYENKAEKLWRILERHNGTAVGIFGGDECLAGNKNNRGTELCSVVELMYSCELLFALTGKRVWLDRLEKIAFNALPATLSDDMWTHQYNQMTNQISCQKLPYKSYFGTNIQESHIFGLEPNYGCCTADHTQGWPKLAASLFMKSRFGIVNTIMLPSSVETKIKGSNVKISIETEYPFRLCGKYTVSVEKETEFELKIRVPNYVMNIYVDGKEYKKTDYIKIKKLWNGETTILVEYKTIPKIVKRPYGMFAVEYGPLVFALPIETEYVMREYELGGVERKYPYCDYDLLPKSEWRYAFAGSDFTVVECDGDDVPFSSVAPRIKLSAILARINWEYEEGYCDIAKYKASPDPISDPETIMLHPYGCAKLRVTEMPFIKTK